MCLDPHLNQGWGWCHKTSLSPPVKYFTDRSKATLLLWIFYVCLSYVCYAFVIVCLYVPCGHLLGKGWPLGSRLWCLAVSLSLFHWYPGSGVVLDCIDSWSLHPYLLWLCISTHKKADPYQNVCTSKFKMVGLSPLVKYFYWPFQGSASFDNHLCYFCLVFYAFMHVRLLMPCSHLLGKGWPLGSRLWCLIVTLSLSHWYPGSGVVSDCIDSWYLPFFLLCYSYILTISPVICSFSFSRIKYLTYFCQRSLSNYLT